MIPAEEFFDRIRQQYTSGLPFAAYRKPYASAPEGAVVKALLQPDDKLHYVTDFSEKGFVFAPFDQDSNAVLIPCHTDGGESVLLTTRFACSRENGDKSGENDQDREVRAGDNARQQHIALVSRGINEIRKGRLEKVVLSRREEVNITVKDPVAIFRKLLEQYNDAFCYLWYHPKEGLWLGATPETLLRIKGAVLHTMALAGTRKFTGDTSIHWGEKEKQEQQVVTDSIVDSLRYKVKSLKISGTRTHRAGNLLHIRTDIQATLISGYKSENLAPLLKSLHPTPAVCGFPREEARQFIKEHEGYSRSFYSGFLGEFNSCLSEEEEKTAGDRDCELFVNLRCMQLSGDRATLYVGGGITRDSDPVAEWEETVNKSYTIKRILET